MIADLQTRIAELIEARDWFAGVSVLSELQGDLQNQIDRAMAGLGFAVVVITPQGVIERTPQGRIRLRHNMAINAVENYLMNQTGKRAGDAVPQIILALHDAWNGLGQSNPRSELNRILITDYEYMPDPDGLTVYQVRATTLSTLTSIDE